VLDSKELLARLEAKKIRNVDIARVLGLPDSRVPEIRRGDRALKLDEGVKLVRAFGLEPFQAEGPLPQSVLRLIVRWVAARVPAQPNDEQVEAAAKALRAFSAFAADPKVRQSVEAAEGFFRALSLQLPELEEEAPSETDPDRER
jgi:hypothetical protein